MSTRGALFGPFRRVVDWALPPLCLDCRKPVADHPALCAACWRKLTFIERPLCDRLGLPLEVEMDERALSPEALAAPPAFNRARAAFLYDEAGRALITGLKFSDRVHLAEPLGRWMARAGRDILCEAHMLTPVPLHWRRLLGRSYNQAAELARVISRLTGVPYAPQLLRRRRHTRRQIGLDRAGRRANLADAIVLDAEAAPSIHGRRIVVVDDVLTTGATLEACARVLLRGGARQVDVLTAAHAWRSHKDG